ENEGPRNDESQHQGQEKGHGRNYRHEDKSSSVRLGHTLPQTLLFLLFSVQDLSDESFDLLKQRIDFRELQTAGFVKLAIANMIGDVGHERHDLFLICPDLLNKLAWRRSLGDDALF